MILLTGFGGYGGQGSNPSSLLADRLDGSRIGGHEVVGRILPVGLGAVRRDVPLLLNELQPDLVLSLGLWPGEPVIRLERLAANYCDFEMPDMGDAWHQGPVRPGQPDAYQTTLPLDLMQQSIRDAGIPCRTSMSAGTYLCNALYYLFSDECQSRSTRAVGFMHLPYMPSQVVALMDNVIADPALELHQRSDFASMSLADMERAIHAGLSCALEEIA